MNPAQTEFASYLVQEYDRETADRYRALVQSANYKTRLKRGYKKAENQIPI